MFNKEFSIPVEELYPILIYEFVTGKLPSKATHEERLLWQKVGYIAQQLGAALDDYIFSWHKAGPYSPGYTSLLYDFPSTLDEVFNYRLNDFTQEILAPMKVIIENVPKNISISKWFELVASVLYIKKNSGLSKKDVFKSLKRKKPFFDDEDINNSVWDLLGNLNMLK